MDRLWAVICRDAKNVTHSAISIVICIGLAVMPSFYAWFNIAGSWDPYSNTANLKVALANSDEGYSSELLPTKLNLGERVVSDLSKSDKIGYVVVDEEKALEGVRSGEYYAAIVFPQDFSNNMMSVLGGGATKAHVTYYSNQKRNAIASIVTEKASTSVIKTVNQTFTESLVGVGAGMLDNLTSYLNDEQTIKLAQSLDGALDSTTSSLRATAKTIETYAAVTASLGRLLDGSDKLVGGSASSLNNAGELLRQTAGGVDQVEGAINGATTSINDTFAKEKGSLESVADAINSAFDVAGGQTDDIVRALGSARDTIGNYEKRVKDVRERVNEVNDTIKGLGLGAFSLDGLVSQLDATIAQIESLDSSVASAQSDLTNAKTDAETSKRELGTLIANATASTTKLSDTYEQTLRSSLGRLSSAISDAASSADGITTSLMDNINDLSSMASATKDNLTTLNNQLTDASSKLSSMADSLDKMQGSLAAATATGDIQTIRTVIGSNPSALAAFVSSPVKMSRTAVYSVENNGSAMAPYYTAMSLWVGGTLMGCVVAARLSKRAIKETNAKPRHAYFGRLAFFLTIGFAQSTINILGELFFLGIQCQHPLLYMLVGWCASLVFINIIYSLTVSFGDIGKAVAVLFMVVQVAGSGGTFPSQMLPSIFQKVYPFLPFVHAETAMRACIAGINGNEYWLSMGKLALFLVPALLLGLWLRKPADRATEWFEHKLESTKLM